MSLDGYIGWVRRVLPSPFTIAILLTIFTFGIVLITSHGDETMTDQPFPVAVLSWWSSGLWNPPLMVFAMQMMLMLVLGHVLALSPAVDRFISLAVRWCDSTSKAAAIVTFFSLVFALFNWGLGLIFGAVFARKVGEHAAAENRKINYPLIGAAGYSGLMIWHCGLSGSALIKAAEPGHLAELLGAETSLLNIPESIPLQATFLSPMNVTVILASLLLLPALVFFLGSRSEGHVPTLNALPSEVEENKATQIGAERLDQSKWLSTLLGICILVYTVYLAMSDSKGILGFFTPNNINLLLLALCISLHRSFADFLAAVDKAIGGASGILIQFPLYFGIIGLMSKSGLASEMALYFASISTNTTYPLLTFFSAGIVNIFVPSGGGQWSIQGPMIIESSAALGIDYSKSILALAYGDQLTNMLQPFWALPLLGITQLGARDILPYTLFFFLAGLVIFSTALLLF